MVRKICFSLFFICLLLAIPLAFMGVEKVEIGGPLLSFIRATSLDFAKLKLEIPQIPLIPLSNNIGFGWDILKAIVTFFNFFIGVQNAFIRIFNVIIQLLEFIGILLKNAIAFKDTMARYPMVFMFD